MAAKAPIKLTILDNDTVSDLLLLHARETWSATIYAPGTLDGVVTVEVSPDGSLWSGLLTGADPVDVPAGAARVITVFHASRLRLKMASEATADREFWVLYSLEDRQD